MAKYQIHEITTQYNHAGSKATADIFNICNQLGFIEESLVMYSNKPGIYNKLMRQIYFMRGWENAYQSITNNSIVVLQHPFHYPQINRDKILKKLKEKKNVKFVSVVHDVQNLRTNDPDPYYKNEFQTMLNIADILIVHNKQMYDYFRKIGVDEKKLVVLNIFDYLIKDNITSKPTFSKDIVIAGNLDSNKCEYLKEINKVKANFELYGPNYNDNINKSNNIHYNGSFPPDQLPKVLNKGFGLVWDGKSVDTCDGPFGQYLKYNNPHKLSLYLASGLPVIIWDEAAEAKFVKENNVGILVHSLHDVENIFSCLKQEDYDQLAFNAAVIGKKLQNGDFFRAALMDALSRLGG